MDYKEEISFGAFDSKLMRQEIFIPEGFEATIEGSKIILKKIESEDEKIRKELLAWLQNTEGQVLPMDRYNAAVAWLKKQGQEPRKVSIWKHWKDGICGNGEGKLIYLIKNGDDYSLSSSLSLECDYILLSELDDLMLEKQGEQKLPIEKLPSEMKSIGESLGVTTQEECDEYNKMMSNLIMSDDKVEQKSADKIKPKFKVGDWIIRSAEGFKHSTYLITEVKDYYVCEELKGRRVTFTFNDVHKNFKLWDISDAKPGDVLYFNNNISSFHSIGLFKRLASKNEINGNTYRCYARYGGFNEENRLEIAQKNDELCHFGTEACPATKEQSDTLMKAMADVGWEFDFEKKELKKIEDEKYNGEGYGIDSLYHAQRILEKTLGEVEGYQSDDGILEHECAISAVKNLYKQKPAWSEEDEKMFNFCCEYLDDTQEDWLKSLKDRYTWKPSDEQMEELSVAKDSCFDLSYKTKNALKSLYKDLKKLK